MDATLSLSITVGFLSEYSLKCYHHMIPVIVH